MTRRRIVGFMVIFLIVVSLYWFVFEPVFTSFLIVPGGSDVIVTIDGHYSSPTVMENNSNLYNLGLHHGRHIVRVSKPGYVSQSLVIIVKWSDGEIYPQFPDLTPICNMKGEVDKDSKSK